jgi:hypothetical protein
LMFPPGWVILCQCLLHSSSFSHRLFLYVSINSVFYFSIFTLFLVLPTRNLFVKPLGVLEGLFTSSLPFVLMWPLLFRIDVPVDIFSVNKT